MSTSPPKHTEPSKPQNTNPTTDSPPTSTSADAPSDEALLAESNDLKSLGTQHFTSSNYDQALESYTRALHPLPLTYSYEHAVLHANISACYLKLENWKEAVESAGKCVDECELLDPGPVSERESEEEDAAEGTERTETQERGGPGLSPSNGKRKSANTQKNEAGQNSVVQEIDDATEERMQTFQESGHTITAVRKLRTKALLRRAKARTEIGTWAELSGAVEDYTQLWNAHQTASTNSPSPSSTPLKERRACLLAPSDLQIVTSALKTLPGKLDAQKQKEVDDMMGKLKQLGNGILKPFGLSTENFRFEQQEGGGYAMNFKQG